jgi:hypothetical protein
MAEDRMTDNPIFNEDGTVTVSFDEWHRLRGEQMIVPEMAHLEAMPALEITSPSPLMINFDVNEYLRDDHSETELFDLLGKLKDFFTPAPRSADG